MADKICPTCHRPNQVNSTFCIYCGASLAHSLRNQPSTRKIDEATEAESALKKAVLGTLKTPDTGIAFYLIEQATMAAIIEDQEFIVGRKITDTQAEQFLDLAPFGGYENGISHRHALVRKTATGYEILDLYSTNGTAVDGQQLLPLKPFPIRTGSTIRLGKLRLYVLFSTSKSE